MVGVIEQAVLWVAGCGLVATLVSWLAVRFGRGTFAALDAVRARVGRLGCAALFALGLVCTICAQKGTNAPPRRLAYPVASDLRPGDALTNLSGVASSLVYPTNFPPVEGLSIWGFAKGTNAVALGLAWPAFRKSADYIHVYANWTVAGDPWTFAGDADVWLADSNAVVEVAWPSVFAGAVAFGDFPTNATMSAGFFAAAWSVDSDGDGTFDGEERFRFGTDPLNADTDGDGLDDTSEIDGYFGTDPLNADTDGDGLPDGWEVVHRLDPLDADDAADDDDGDGLSNLMEFRTGGDPMNADTDGDGLGDAVEIGLGTDPANADTDGDGVRDGVEISAGEDPLHIEYRGPGLPSSADPEAYCTIDLTAAEPLTLVTFTGDDPSDLADPRFHVFSNETVRVTILIGKTYAITSSAPIVCTGMSDFRTVVSNVSETALSVVRPVTISCVPGNAAGAFRLSVTPSWLDGVFSFGTNACCSVEETGSRTFRFACAADCSCGGCAIDSFFTYEGYSLFYRIASCCCTPPPKETLTFALDRGTAFVNDDDDDGDGTVDSLHPFATDDDVVTGRIEFRSGTPVTGTIRVSDRDGFSGWIFSSFGMTDETDSWELSGDTSFTKTLYFSPDFFSAGRAGSEIAVRWEPSSGSDGLTATDRLVVTEPVVEPICSDQTNVTVDGVAHTYTVNPSGIVVGRNSYFRIGLEPADFPDEEIVWEAVGSGRIAFMGGNRGRSVCVRGVRAGEAELQVRIGDCGSEIPRFPVRVVTNSVVKLSAWIVSDEEGKQPRTVDKVRELIRQVNDIYAQVGVSFDIGDRIAITNIPRAYNILWEGTTNTMWNFDQLVDTHTNTGGLELYFVNAFHDTSGARERTRGGSTNHGIVLAVTADAVTIAHEIGHAFGLRDIYISNDESDTGIPDSDIKSVGLKRVCWDHVSGDWNSDSVTGQGVGGTRYYAPGLLQRDLIPRLLMYGIYNAGKRDLSAGPVYGVWYYWGGGTKIWQAGDAPVGTSDPSTFDISRTHL